MLNQFYEAPDSLYNEKKEKPKTEKEKLIKELEKTIMQSENRLRFLDSNTAPSLSDEKNFILGLKTAIKIINNQ